MENKLLLQSKGIRPSVIRLEMLKYLSENRIHPTVDDIFNYLSEKIPTLSRTSVYNNLKLLVDNDIVIELNVDKVQARYEYDINLHGHFVCDECGYVYDFALDVCDNDVLKGFDVKVKNVCYKGVCKNCLLNKSKYNI